MPNFISRRQFTIEWGHCDPAGIVFNARFFEFFDWSTWGMFERALGVKAHEWPSIYGVVGIPLVDSGARFISPARFGDVVETDVAGDGISPLEFRRRTQAHRARRDSRRRPRDARLGRARSVRSGQDEIEADPAGSHCALSKVHRLLLAGERAV